MRALERRIGQQLLDRSGRRVVPTDAGQRLYRSAQRMLAAEEQLLSGLTGTEDGELTGTLEIGASTGPAATSCRSSSGSSRASTRGFARARRARHADGRLLVAERELELGIVGAARRHRSVEFSPFFSDAVILVCPPEHRFAGRTVMLDELGEGPLIVMQEGAGVRQLVEDELRRQGKRLRDLRPSLVLGLQESVRPRSCAGYGVTFISRLADGGGARRRAGSPTSASRASIWSEAVLIARAAGRVPTRVAEAFLSFAAERLA